jgi:UTP-glucose-1-phosphate uridylyltransferase
MERLINNKDFVDLIIKDYIENGIKHYVLTENVDNDKIRDELKARKILKDYIELVLDEENKQNLMKG